MKGKRKKFPRIIFSKSLFALLILFLLFFSYSLIKEINRKKEIQAEIKNLEKELVYLDKENNQLQNLIEYLKTDEYAELEAKKKLGLKREGEKVILVTENSQEDFKLLETQPVAEANWKLWWGHFFKKNR